MFSDKPDRVGRPGLLQYGRSSEMTSSSDGFFTALYGTALLIAFGRVSEHAIAASDLLFQFRNALVVRANGLAKTLINLFAVGTLTGKKSSSSRAFSSMVASLFSDGQYSTVPPQGVAPNLMRCNVAGQLRPRRSKLSLARRRSWCAVQPTGVHRSQTDGDEISALHRLDPIRYVIRRSQNCRVIQRQLQCLYIFKFIEAAFISCHYDHSAWVALFQLGN